MKPKISLVFCFAMVLFFALLSLCPVMGDEKPLEKIPDNTDQSEWFQKAMNNIRKMEYEVSWQEKSSLPHGKPRAGTRRPVPTAAITESSRANRMTRQWMPW